MTSRNFRIASEFSIYIPRREKRHSGFTNVNEAFKTGYDVAQVLTTPSDDRESLGSVFESQQSIR